MEANERVLHEVMAAAAELTEAQAELDRLHGTQAAYRSSGIRWFSNPSPEKVAELEKLEGLPPEELLRWVTRPTPEEQAYWERRRSGDFSEERERFRVAWSRLFSPEFKAEVERLKAGDASGAAYAIAYIEADPWHYHSGYLKERYARWLRRVELTHEQNERLRAAVLAAIQKGRREDLREYVTLGRKLDSPNLRRRLEELVALGDEGTRYRARRMLDACRLNDVVETEDGRR